MTQVPYYITTVKKGCLCIVKTGDPVVALQELTLRQAIGIKAGLAVFGDEPQEDLARHYSAILDKAESGVRGFGVLRLDTSFAA